VLWESQNQRNPKKNLFLYLNAIKFSACFNECERKVVSFRAYSRRKKTGQISPGDFVGFFVNEIRKPAQGFLG